MNSFQRRNLLIHSGALVLAVGGVTPTWASSKSKVDHLGATGDGVADDFVPLQAALDKSSFVNLRPGANYRVSRSLRLHSGLTVSGANSSTIKGEGVGPVLLAEGASDIKLHDFSIIGGGAKRNAKENHGLLVDWRLKPGKNIECRGLHITDLASSGITALASASSRSSDLNIQACVVKNTGGHGIISQDYIDDVTIAGCHVENSGLSIADRPGITASRNGRRIQIVGNICIGSPDALGRSVHGISFDRCAEGLARDNQCIGWIGYGIEVGGSSECVVSANKVSDCYYGIVCSALQGQFQNKNIRISNNIITNSKLFGLWVFLTNANGSTKNYNIAFADNYVYNTGSGLLGAPYRIENCDGCSIRGGEIDQVRGAAIQLQDASGAMIVGVKVRNALPWQNDKSKFVSIRWSRAAGIAPRINFNAN